MIKVVKPKTDAPDKLQTNPDAWRVVLEIQERSVPAMKLTKRALTHWQRENNKFIFGYVDFGALQKNDILSVLSAVKQGNARLSRNRFGQVSTYKLLVA